MEDTILQMHYGNCDMQNTIQLYRTVIRVTTVFKKDFP